MTESRLLPHNIDAEENVISSLLLNGELINSLTLEPSDFYCEPTRECYAACKALANRGVGLNQITVAQELNEWGKLETVGGAAYLSHLIATCVTPLDCQYYVDITKRLSTYRRMITVGNKVSELGYAQGPDITVALNNADEMLLSLRQNGVVSPIITPRQRARIMSERYELLYGVEAGVALPTGLKDLDNQIGGGLFAGEMVVIAARPGMGKTTLLMNVANSVAGSHTVLVCSAEMSVVGITHRDVASVLGKTTNEVRRGSYNADTYCRITGEGLQSVIDRRLYFYQETPLTTAKIFQAGINMRLRYGLDLIAVDYLGLLDDDYGKSQYERIGYISRKLKQMAMKLDVPILVAHQLNRVLESRQDKRPQLHDLRDSGRVEEDADLVLFLYRESYYRDNVDDVSEIIIAKQRQGEGHRVVRVFFDSKHQMYCDISRA